MIKVSLKLTNKMAPYYCKSGGPMRCRCTWRQQWCLPCLLLVVLIPAYIELIQISVEYAFLVPLWPIKPSRKILLLATDSLIMELALDIDRLMYGILYINIPSDANSNSHLELFHLNFLKLECDMQYRC